MLELVKASTTAPLWMIAGAFLLYLVQKVFEAQLERRAKRLEQIDDNSLKIKTGLRSGEQDALVDFRQKIEQWEYFLQTGIGDIALKSNLGDFDPARFYDADTQFYGAVRLAAVRASVLLRDGALELELLETIGAIRKLYYPLIAQASLDAIEVKRQLDPFLLRIRQFEDSGLKNMAVALSKEESEQVVGLRQQLSAVLAEYCHGLVTSYQPIAEHLMALKERINVYIYRPLVTAAVDRD